jgi:glycosyltransferase involved in cell wall biosynthesis
MFDYIIFTHIPAFYKVNLYNELNKNLKIHVVFIALTTSDSRSLGFTSVSNINFSYDVLSDGCFQKRNKLHSLIKLNKLLKGKKYNKILVGGWDLIEYWFLVLLSPKFKNCLILESTYFESNVSGVKGLLKKIFLSNVSCVFASGFLHSKLLDVLSYSGIIKITKGVGLINKPCYLKNNRRYNKKYLYVGRLSFEKNLFFLVNLFNSLSDFELTIIGAGPDEEKLKKLSNGNIHFLGPIKNESLKEFYLGHDIFILPSIKEAWGLVVEEALYFGMPVIVSDRAGSSELIVHGHNGYLIEALSEDIVRNILLNISFKSYNQLVTACQSNYIESKDKDQLASYSSIFCPKYKNIATRLLTSDHPIVEFSSGNNVKGIANLSEGGLRTQNLHKANLSDKPLITVITVVFNDAKNLEKTIKSVINQDYYNMEYIIIDGGSNDGTLEIIKKYEHVIDYWVSETDKGVYDGMNKGIDLVTGDWINFMNSGDTFYNPSIVKDIFSEHEFLDTDIIFGNHNVVYPNKTRFVKSKSVAYFWKGSRFCHQSTFAKSDLCKESKFNLHNRISADFEFFYNAYINNKCFKSLNVTIAIVSSGGLSDLNRVDSIVGWWNVVEKTPITNCYYLYRLLIEIIKIYIKKIIKI